MEINKIIQGDCLEQLKKLSKDSIDCVITSPPYWALRDYGVEGQLGLEPTFQEYIDKLCDIFDEIKRILKKKGTCWVNIGDTYSGNKGIKKRATITEKCLCQIPSRFAIEMTNRGWILRNEIIWYKPNCIPSSVKDRFTIDFEKVFFFVKNKKYWFETQREPNKDISIKRAKYEQGRNALGKNPSSMGYKSDKYGMPARYIKLHPEGHNKRCVWKINTKSFPEAHFAVFPEKLIEPMVKAGCPENGVVLDPFMGAGTTAVVAKKLKRKWLGIELNPEYIKISEKRINSKPKPIF